MGFLASMLDRAQKNILEAKYGIRRPRDAERVLENIVGNRNRSNEEKVHFARPILLWLSRLSMQSNREAERVLEHFRFLHKGFLKDNNIQV